MENLFSCGQGDSLDRSSHGRRTYLLHARQQIAGCPEKVINPSDGRRVEE
jgi:hypothetical protein